MTHSDTETANSGGNGEAKYILSINAGSSSVKLSLYLTNHNCEPKTIITASISSLTSSPAKFTYQDHSSPKDPVTSDLDSVDSHESAFRHFLCQLEEQSFNPPISFICHRIVHGGSFTKPTILSSSTISELNSLSSFAPLHNAPALSLVHASLKALPDATQIAYFDTLFHSTIPTAVSTYAISRDVTGGVDQSQKDQDDPRPSLRKYGFHGISYIWILNSVAEYLHQPVSETSIIALHLGSGASACAIQDGKSIDTTMGLTPASGLPGATRAGDLDPTLVFHLMKPKETGKQKDVGEGLKITEAEEVLNMECGWAGMTGTKEFGEIAEGWIKGDKDMGLAFEVFVDRVVGYVGNYWTKMGGRCDALVFSGGIGEKSNVLRREVVRRLSCLGFRIDERRNGKLRDGTVVGIGGERVSDDGGRVLVVRTDEERMMARECARDGRFWS
ncbi:Similar to Probable acetate kinase; acc. no. Q7SH17 [Pyronema omphalodes CBS 100304]|uniref:Probable acetate kinase n=1 Tax=Pyronema omphalodes (strain CBS 100304) TaxID=1076935 RepID=U4LF07_PYROM|nr:Similar to Probable acetate kinase; acc. no. Q7SH17 [Pyronema omphalodes CBS 100304]